MKVKFKIERSFGSILQELEEAIETPMIGFDPDHWSSAAGAARLEIEDDRSSATWTTAWSDFRYVFTKGEDEIFTYGDPSGNGPQGEGLQEWTDVEFGGALGGLLSQTLIPACLGQGVRFEIVAGSSSELSDEALAAINAAAYSDQEGVGAAALKLARQMWRAGFPLHEGEVAKAVAQVQSTIQEAREWGATVEGNVELLDNGQLVGVYWGPRYEKPGSRLNYKGQFLIGAISGKDIAIGWAKTILMALDPDELN